jgi:hypothetical protein
MALRREVEERFKAMANPQISPAVQNALEELDIVPARFDGWTNEALELLGKLGKRYQEPITNPDQFIYELLQHFEVVRKLEDDLIVIDKTIADAYGRTNDALQHFLTKKQKALELMFQLCEVFAKLQRRVATLMDLPQGVLGDLEDALEEQRAKPKPKRPRLSGSLRKSSKRSGR